MITAAPAERNNMTYKTQHVINNSPSLILGASKVALDVDDTLLIEENTKYKQLKIKVYTYQCIAPILAQANIQTIAIG